MWADRIGATSFSKISVQDCPRGDRGMYYCVKNVNGIALSYDGWLIANASFVPPPLSFNYIGTDMLPLRQLQIGDGAAVYTAYKLSQEWRVGLDTPQMKNYTKNGVIKEFMMIHSDLCDQCCFIIAKNFTRFSPRDNVSEIWNGVVFWSGADVFISTDNNKPNSMLNMLWSIAPEFGGKCNSGKPLKIQEIMVVPFDLELPPPEEIRIPRELEVTAPALRAGALHLGKYCEFECKELTLCRQETRDPRKCLQEGAETTACAVNFFQKVKKHCRDEFNRYAHCVEFGSTGLALYPCRKLQRVFDKCMLEKLNLDRPPLGYYSRPHVHESTRPVPPPQFQRDYYAEAKAMMDELPDDYPVHKEYKRYYRGHIQPWMA